MDRSPSKILDEGNTVDTVGEGNERRIKEKVVFPTGGGEATNPEKAKALYSLIWSWCTEEEDDIPFLE